MEGKSERKQGAVDPASMGTVAVGAEAALMSPEKVRHRNSRYRTMVRFQLTTDRTSLRSLASFRRNSPLRVSRIKMRI